MSSLNGPSGDNRRNDTYEWMYNIGNYSFYFYSFKDVIFTFL